MKQLVQYDISTQISEEKAVALLFKKKKEEEEEECICNLNAKGGNYVNTNGKLQSFHLFSPKASRNLHLAL